MDPPETPLHVTPKEAAMSTPVRTLVLRLFAAALLGCCSLAASANVTADQQFRSRCENQLPKVNVDLRVKMADYLVDSTVSSSVLNVKSDHAKAGDKLLGLTSIRSIIEFGYDGPSLEDASNGVECAAPQIDVELRYMPVLVYVAREFIRDTCPYREIMAHELRHVRAYEAQLPQVQATVLKALHERFGGAPIYGERGKTFAQLKQEVDTLWIPFIRAELKKLDRMHAEIDTTEETMRMSNACFGEVALTLNSHY